MIGKKTIKIADKIDHMPLKETNGDICIRRLAGEKCDVIRHGHGTDCYPPGANHCWLLEDIKNDQPVYFIGEYGNLGPNYLKEIIQLCMELSLSFSIEPSRKTDRILIIYAKIPQKNAYDLYADYIIGLGD